MTSAASAVSFGQTGLSGFGKGLQGLTGAQQQIQSGTQTAEMDQFQAQQMLNASEYGQTQAAQTDMTMRQALQQQLGTMMATRASANTVANDPTSAAILARTQTQGDQQRTIQVGNYEAQAAQAAQDQQSSAFYTTAAQQTLQDAYSNANMSLFGGFLGAGSSLLTGLSGLNWSGFNTSLPNNANGQLIGFKV